MARAHKSQSSGENSELKKPVYGANKTKKKPSKALRSLIGYDEDI